MSNNNSNSGNDPKESLLNEIEEAEGQNPKYPAYRPPFKKDNTGEVGLDSLNDEFGLSSPSKDSLRNYMFTLSSGQNKYGPSQGGNLEPYLGLFTDDGERVVGLLETNFNNTSISYDKLKKNVVTIGNIALWLAGLLTLYTGFDYLKSGLKHF